MRIFWALLFSAVTLVAADINRPMQRFLLPDVQGHDHDSIGWKGKPMVLEFMAPDCPHCLKFISILKQAQQKYGDRITVVAMVNPPTTPERVRQLIDQQKITYPILLDAGRVAFAYIRKQAFDLPYVFLIDSDGMIRESYEYSPTTVDFFYGDAMLPRIDSLFKTAVPASPKQ